MLNKWSLPLPFSVVAEDKTKKEKMPQNKKHRGPGKKTSVSKSLRSQRIRAELPLTRYAR